MRKSFSLISVLVCLLAASSVLGTTTGGVDGVREDGNSPDLFTENESIDSTALNAPASLAERFLRTRSYAGMYDSTRPRNRDHTSTRNRDVRGCPGGQFELSLPPLPGKKGFGITLRDDEWEFNIEKVKLLNVSWNYSWGSKRIPAQPDDIEFVPMIWGDFNVARRLEEDIIPEFQAHRVHRVLAFNEPDHAQQANMAVEDVLARWPLLEGPRIPLASPSVAHPFGNWSRSFFQQADEKCLRMEYTAVHWYGGAGSPENFKQKMTEAYESYGHRPLLITEFAPADWQAGSPADNRWSRAQVLTFMKDVLPWLEHTDFIAGYSWFNFAPTNKAGVCSCLFESRSSKELTALGRFYASVTPENPNGDQTITM